MNFSHFHQKIPSLKSALLLALAFCVLPGCGKMESTKAAITEAEKETESVLRKIDEMGREQQLLISEANALDGAKPVSWARAEAEQAVEEAQKKAAALKPQVKEAREQFEAVSAELQAYTKKFLTP